MSALEGLRDRAVASLREAQHLLEELTEDPSYEEGSPPEFALDQVYEALAMLDEPAAWPRLVVDNSRHSDPQSE